MSNIPRGDDRRPPIGLSASLDGATAEQRWVVDLIAAGPRGSVPKPFLAMLDVPRLAEAIQEVGVVLRYSSSLPPSLREIAILATAAAVPCGYEWNYHAPIAREAGVPDAVISATRARVAGGTIDAVAASVIDLCRAVVATGEARAGELAAVVDRLGRVAATEIIAIAGYYRLLAGFIKTAGFDEPLAPA